MFELVAIVAAALSVLATGACAALWAITRPGELIALRAIAQEHAGVLQHLKDVELPAIVTRSATLLERAEDTFEAAEVKRKRAAALRAKDARENGGESDLESALANSQTSPLAARAALERHFRAKQ